MAEQTPTVLSSEILKGKMNWPTIEASITAGTCKVSKLADELGVKPIEVRNLLLQQYNDKIVFKVGRTGGVYWVNKMVGGLNA